MKQLKRCLSAAATSCLMVLFLDTPLVASAHPLHFSLERTPNQFTPATPEEWQNQMRHSQIDSQSYGAHIKYVGEFTRTTNTIDLSKYSMDEIFFGCVGDLNEVTRKTKIIVLPYTTLIKTKEFPAPTIGDRISDYYSQLYAITVTQWKMNHAAHKEN